MCFLHCENISMISKSEMILWIFLDPRKNIRKLLKNSIIVKIATQLLHIQIKEKYFIRSQWGVVYVMSQGDSSMKFYREVILCVPWFGH